MLQEFKKHIEVTFPFLSQKKIILATSGGLDSMVMAHLFAKLDYNFAIAHCNFQLRGIESFEDQKFVEDFAQQLAKPVFVTQFDTLAFASDYKLSVQVAARELRYNWFYELLETEHYDYILTAHHSDDNLETFLINLTRGTGLEGLVGIPESTEKLLRPLLPFSRLEIKEFAEENHIKWREDSSNASTKYIRNKIRHELVPILKEINPKFLEVFQKTQSYLQQAQEMVEDASIMIYQQVAEEIGDEVHVNLDELKRLPNYQSYLYQWFNEYGFTAWNDIYDLVNGQSGKQVLAAHFRLIKDRNTLILCPNQPTDAESFYLIEETQPNVNLPLKLTFGDVSHLSSVSNNTIFVDKQKLQFPLTLRKWKEGDVFYPFGMDGKSKKISKFFKDEKLSLPEKENVWLLCSNNQIVWIVGKRADDRFKIENTTTQIFKITLNE
ncbi:tRNA lysidine(34) synthetase TilS [Flavobacterium agrisoli]|uniref:tRNA(Ile)-lysidine synthase n=1 Tax=Flavobacterium agrisoli TaxID=2793066 RepID=A0A934PM24_9FLAO|nr:tRNA lysidine(34) synthetase TilS [Flavobacterium agrisoli]MBK0368961.1 tRNA lysidine(34) synthetase TilS [Flavobacterium agrisoli]